MSLPPIPSGQWFWGKGTPAGGLRAWLEQLRTSTYTKVEIDTLVADSGTSEALVRQIVSDEVSLKMDAKAAPSLLARPEASRDRAGVLTLGVVGTVTAVSGQYGQAWNLAAGSLTFPTTDHIDPNQGTILIRLAGYDATAQAVVYEATNGTGFHRIIVNPDQSILLRFGSGAASQLSGLSLPTSGSHVLAVTWGAGGVRAYLNGTPGSLLAYTPAALAASAWISGLPPAGGSLRYLAPVEAVLISDEALLSGEITRLSTMGAWTWTATARPSPEALAVDAVLSEAFVGDATTDAIQAQIDAAAASGGGTVRMPRGVTVDVTGTIQLRPNVTLDLNGSTLRAVNNAAFTSVSLGMDTMRVPTTTYNPSHIKPLVSLIGAEGEHLVGAGIRNGTIDGNGTNQPDEGSYANVAVFWADDTTVEDVVSVNARPGITINLPGGANTGRRAFCLFIGNANRTHVIRGIYDNAGYDAIGLRLGAVDTNLTGVTALRAAKGSIQVATGALRTKIIGGVYDNTAGGSTESHAIFTHSAKWMDVMGATMRANTGSCFVAFGDTAWGPSTEINVGNCAMEQSGTGAPMVNLGSGYVEGANLHDITFRATQAQGPLLFISGATIKNITAQRWVGSTPASGHTFQVLNAQGVTLAENDIVSGVSGNQLIYLSGASRVRIGGRYVKTTDTGVGVLVNACTDVELRGATIAGASDSVYALGGNSIINVIDCDLTGVTNVNKLRIYGPDSGTVRGNRGVPTEGNGTATVAAGATSVTLSHGLWPGTGTTVTPQTPRVWLPRDFQVSFAGNPGAARSVWVSAVTPTQVTFTVDAAPGVDVPLVWSARMDRTA